MPPAARISGAVLAAGAGTRMGAPKAGLVVDGVRLVDRATTALRAAGCEQVIAVVREGVPADGAVVNPHPEHGLRSSLLCALDAATGDALVVLLADMPGVGATTIQRVVEAWRPGRVVQARYTDGRGHPTIMAPELWRAALEEAGPDEGARTFLARHEELIDVVQVGDDPADLDSPTDLSRWSSRS